MLMSSFHDFQFEMWNNEQRCLYTGREVADFSNVFRPGFWCYGGLGSEKSWKNNMLSNDGNPNGKWDDTSHQDERHPHEFLLSSGTLRTSAGMTSTYYTADDDNIMMLTNNTFP